ncbi:MAG TPA: DoxX family protein [Pseudonocardiaceae bacterium]
MNVVLWVLQGLLAAVFLGSGGVKLTQPYEKAAKRLAWVQHFKPSAVRLIGTAEALGALGLILPAATHIAPILTPIAAAGLAATMIGAVITHVRLRDPISQLVPSAVLLVLSAVVVWGRFGPYHF